jgi:hypothetical protein
MMAAIGPCCRRIVSLQELAEGGFLFEVLLRLGIKRLHLIEFIGSPSPQAGMAVKRMPLWITQKISQSDIDWMSDNRRSGAPVVNNCYPTHPKAPTIPRATTVMKTISFVRMATAMHYTKSFV